MAAAASILLDCVCSIKAGGANIGESAPAAGWPVGAGTTFNADKITFRETTAKVDHRGGQDRHARPRPLKKSGEITVEAKMGLGAVATLWSVVKANDTVQILMTPSVGGAGLVGGSFTVGVQITSRSVDYDNPSTVKFGGRVLGPLPALS